MKTVMGDPDPKHVSTSFVERQNLSMRMGMRRFTRLTNAFSKKVENHAASVAIYFMYYNFCRVHQTLRVTPAMEAGLTDHVWTSKNWLRCFLSRNQRSAALTKSEFQTAPLRVPRAHQLHRRCGAAREMRVGPSEPAIRRRLQTTASCWTLRALVVSVAGKGGVNPVSEIWRDERKRTADDVSKSIGRCRNRGEGSGPWDEFGRSPGARPERHPAWRRRESRSGSFVERGNLSLRC